MLNPALWPANLGSDRDWAFQAQPNPHLDGRTIPMSMGKGLGGGSSINVMVWARGHRNDWDYVAAQADDPRWGYENVLDIYRRIENWQGTPDPAYRGSGGPVWVQPAAAPSPVALALLDAAGEIGIPVFDHPNGAMMEQAGGAAITDMLVREGRRHSLYRAYVRPWLDRPNLTVLTGATVHRVLFEDRRAVGLAIEHGADEYGGLGTRPVPAPGLGQHRMCEASIGQRSPPVTDRAVRRPVLVEPGVDVEVGVGHCICDGHERCSPSVGVHEFSWSEASERSRL